MISVGGICDIHGHFLPGMDDGCKTVEETTRLLELCVEQGVEHLVATPHYYPVETVRSFLDRREASWQALRQCGKPLPEILLGAEVAYRAGISQQPDVEKLCIGDSRFLLLEMPSSRWNEVELRDLRSFLSVRRITPILAHIERYLTYQRRETLEQILDMGVLFQMSGEYLLGRFGGFAGRRLIRRGMAHFLGSDCHNLTSRRPNLGQAVKVLEKHGMKKALETLQKNSDFLLREAREI